MRAQRAKQTPAERTALAHAARAAQRHDEIDRMLARCQVFGRTERERLLLAYRYGLGARNSRRYRARRLAAEDVDLRVAEDDLARLAAQASVRRR